MSAGYHEPRRTKTQHNTRSVNTLTPKQLQSLRVLLNTMENNDLSTGSQDYALRQLIEQEEERQHTPPGMFPGWIRFKLHGTFPVKIPKSVLESDDEDIIKDFARFQLEEIPFHLKLASIDQLDTGNAYALGYFDAAGEHQMHWEE